MTITPVRDAAVSYDDLAATLRGELIRPGDAAYDDARAVYNGMIDKYPAAIARCRDTADVITASPSPAPTGSRSPSAGAATRPRASASVTTRS